MLMTLMRPWNLEEGVNIRYAFAELCCEFEFIPKITNCPPASQIILILLWWYRCSSSPSLRPKSFLRSSLLFFLFLWWFFFRCLFPPPNTSAYPTSNSVFKRTRVVSLALEKSERERIVLNINHDFTSDNLQVYRLTEPTLWQFVLWDVEVGDRWYDGGCCRSRVFWVSIGRWWMWCDDDDKDYCLQVFTLTSRTVKKNLVLFKISHMYTVQNGHACVEYWCELQNECFTDCGCRYHVVFKNVSYSYRRVWFRHWSPLASSWRDTSTTRSRPHSRLRCGSSSARCRKRACQIFGSTRTCPP